MIPPLLSEMPRHVVWLHTAFLGDMILLTAAMQLLAQKHPSVSQHLITTPTGAAALRGLPFLTSVLTIDKKKSSSLSYWWKVWALKKSLHDRGILPGNSLLLRPHASTRSALMAGLLGLPSVCHEESSLSFIARARVPRVAVLHECSRIALLLESLGTGREDLMAIRPVLKAEVPGPLLQRFPLLASAGKPLIGIAPGSVWGTKRWPVESFIRLIKLLQSHRDVSIALLGSQEEMAIAEEICRKVPVSPGTFLINLAGQTSLDELRALYPLLSLLVSNDSSPIHYASAFNIPTVAVFGATVPAMGFAPLADGSISLGVSELGCRPCSDHGPKTCPLGHFKCMKDLSPELVAAACLERLPPAGK